MWFLLLWGIGFLTSLIYFFIIGFPKNVSEGSTLLLLHQFVVTFGLLGVIGFIESVLFGDKISKMIAWPGGPYQTKYGFFQLCLGVTGVMAIWFRGSYWVAVLVNMYVFGLSGLWTHIAEMIKLKKLDFMHMANLVINACYQTFITVLSILAGGIWY
jgi:hypothetical protein